MNSMNDSRDFQEVESSHSGRLSYVPSQPAAIPSSPSMLSGDQTLASLTHGIHMDYRKTFLVINIQYLFHPMIILKEFTLAPQQENKDQIHKQQGQGPFSQEMTRQNRGTIPIPTLARRPSTMSSFIPVAAKAASMVGQQRQQISELQFGNFPNPQSFLVGK